MAVEGGGRRSMILHQWFLAVRLSVRPCDGWDEKRKESVRGRMGERYPFFYELMLAVFS